MVFLLAYYNNFTINRQQVIFDELVGLTCPEPRSDIRVGAPLDTYVFLLTLSSRKIYND